MKVTAPQAFSHVTPLGRPVEAGEEVEVDDELGAQLVAQGWTPGLRTGGIVKKSKAALVGERGPETIVPVAPAAKPEEQ